MASQTLPLSALPYFPLDPSWIEQSEAFRHPEPRMAAAFIRVMLAAWRGMPAASIPASHAYLAQVTNLPLEVVGRHFAVLTEGFELLEDGRLHHVQLAKLTGQISSRYGREVEEFALAAAMSLQAPEQFALVAVEPAKAATKGKRTLPKGFGYAMYPELEQWHAANGFPTPEDRAWIMSRFVDYCAAKNPAYKDWIAACRTWSSNELSYHPHLLPSARGRSLAVAGKANPFVERAARGRGDIARDHNTSVFDRVSNGSAGLNAGARRAAPPPDEPHTAYERPRGPQ